MTRSRALAKEEKTVGKKERTRVPKEDGEQKEARAKLRKEGAFIVCGLLGGAMLRRVRKKGGGEGFGRYPLSKGGGVRLGTPTGGVEKIENWRGREGDPICKNPSGGRERSALSF